MWRSGCSVRFSSFDSCSWLPRPLVPILLGLEHRELWDFGAHAWIIGQVSETRAAIWITDLIGYLSNAQDGQSFSGARASKQHFGEFPLNLWVSPFWSELGTSTNLFFPIFRCQNNRLTSRMYPLALAASSSVRPTRLDAASCLAARSKPSRGRRQTRRSCWAPGVPSSSFMRGCGAVGPRKSRRCAASELSTQPRQSLSRSPPPPFPGGWKAGTNGGAPVQLRYNRGGLALRVCLRKNPSCRPTCSYFLWQTKIRF